MSLHGLRTTLEVIWLPTVDAKITSVYSIKLEDFNCDFFKRIVNAIGSNLKGGFLKSGVNNWKKEFNKGDATSSCVYVVLVKDGMSAKFKSYVGKAGGTKGLASRWKVIPANDKGTTSHIRDISSIITSTDKTKYPLLPYPDLVFASIILKALSNRKGELPEDPLESNLELYLFPVDWVPDSGLLTTGKRTGHFNLMDSIHPAD